MGKRKNDWQEIGYILGHFGSVASQARKRYRAYIQDGIARGRRADLSGGGLIRSLGGWSEASLRLGKGYRIKADERILGNGDFVEEVLRRSEERLERKYQLKARGMGLESLARRVEINLPRHARVVVIGGGVLGCSVAYHLAQMGWKDVLLLERDRITSGTTWHAAGLIVTLGSTSSTSTEMRQYTRDLYARLEAETGLSTGFRPVGFIEAAADADRLEEYRRVAAFNRYCGIDVHEISAPEIGERFPLARTDDLLAGFYVKEDGRADPVGVTMALAKGAKLQGARIVEGVAVTAILKKRGVVTGVSTRRVWASVTTMFLSV